MIYKNIDHLIELVDNLLTYVESASETNQKDEGYVLGALLFLFDIENFFITVQEDCIETRMDLILMCLMKNTKKEGWKLKSVERGWLQRWRTWLISTVWKSLKLYSKALEKKTLYTSCLIINSAERKKSSQSHLRAFL
jgi:hypothetical protein